MSRNKLGFAHQALLLLLVVVAVVAAVGYRVVSRNSGSTVSQVTHTAKSSTVSKASLQQAGDALSKDNSTDSQLDPSQLDSDLSQLL